MTTLTETTTGAPIDSLDVRWSNITRAVAVLIVALVILVLSLTAYWLWLEVQPPGKPIAWRDRARGFICYKWGDAMQCYHDPLWEPMP